MPRNVCPPSDHIQLKSLHGYCDASAKAYGVVVYLRVVHKDTTITTHLLMAKSKLAPLKVQTIPRLELCGAQLLWKLLIHKSYLTSTSPNDSIFAWTDSAVVLGWLKISAHRLKVFVAHRITDTLSKVPSNHWRYVNTSGNPADLISRGVSPKDLLNKLWWSGPS